MRHFGGDIGRWLLYFFFAAAFFPIWAFFRCIFESWWRSRLNAVCKNRGQQNFCRGCERQWIYPQRTFRQAVHGRGSRNAVCFFYPRHIPLLDAGYAFPNRYYLDCRWKNYRSWKKCIAWIQSCVSALLYARGANSACLGN